jgi:hypothetical protein
MIGGDSEGEARRPQQCTGTAAIGSDRIVESTGAEARIESKAPVYGDGSIRSGSVDRTDARLRGGTNSCVVRATEVSEGNMGVTSCERALQKQSKGKQSRTGLKERKEAKQPLPSMTCAS